MPQEETNHVALYIDWDNIAISTAADFGGAVPDVRAIVQAAQRYGSILLARAYAEWQVPSDRLAVYKAGVEPVYAPTFRFEPETAGQPSRGKSIADPCLVTDAIDTLHLMPAVTHFVLVSGDKDLIPIVRLAQLRGKKVVVIGPEQVANVLREMSDEYVAYRSLIDVQATTAAAEASGADSRRRRGAPSSSRAAASPSVQQSAVSAALASLAPSPAPSRPHRMGSHGRHIQSEQPIALPARDEQMLPAAVEAPAQEEPPVVPVITRRAEAAPAPVAPPPPAPEPEPEPVLSAPPARATERLVAKIELSTLLPVIESILRERDTQRRPRLRATNLKDLLVSRIPGFSERDYGFVGFRDLVAAAEQAGIVTVHRAGPVQMIELAKGRAELQQPEAPSATENTGVGAASQPDVDLEVVRFIADLRTRSKWLTYTYVLTNLVSHLSERMPGQSVDREARAALDKLVQLGVLKVDREPREIEVAGTRHRVRMCHLEADHELVRRALAEGGSTDDTLTPSVPLTPELDAPVTPFESAPAVATAPSPVSQAVEALGPLPSSLLDSLDGSSGLAPVSRAPLFASGAPSPAEPESVPQPEPETAVPAAATVEESAPPPSDQADAQPLTLDAAIEAVRAVVSSAVTATRPTLGPAGVKTRLTKALGQFDERALGFSKFKDFLLAAEKRGAISVETSGASTRVGMPGQGDAQ